MQKISWRRIFEDFKRRYPGVWKRGAFYSPYWQEQIKIFLPDGRHLIYDYLNHAYRLADESLDWEPEEESPARPVGRPKDANRNLEIRNKVLSGTPIADVAKEYDVTRTRIYQIVEKNDLGEFQQFRRDVARKKRLEQSRRDYEILFKKEGGMSIEDIAKEYGIRPVTVYSIIRNFKRDDDYIYEEDE